MLKACLVKGAAKSISVSRMNSFLLVICITFSRYLVVHGQGTKEKNFAGDDGEVVEFEDLGEELDKKLATFNVDNSNQVKAK